MTNSNNCTCQSGDGSLSHPCPSHPATNELKVGDVVSESIAELERVAAGYAIRAIRVIKQQAAELDAAKKEIERIKLSICDTGLIVAIEQEIDNQLEASGISVAAMQRQDGEKIITAINEYLLSLKPEDKQNEHS